MTSNIKDASHDELINLIYHHLKDNGYRKAAHVLRKHAPQVETEEVKVSLSEIFQKWASSDDGDIPPVPSGVETPKLKGPAKRKGNKSKITAPSAALNPKEPAGVIETPGSASKSPKQKKNKTGSKPRKRKKSSSEDVLVPPPADAAPPNINDSDSDSSLDVDKWRKLLSQFSDVEREKMDVLSILDESSGITANRTRKPRKPRPSKKAENQAKKGKSDTEAEMATAESDDISVTTNASKTSSKKQKDKVSKVKITSKKTGDKKNSNISGLDVVETPKRTKAKKKTSFDQDETDNVEEHHETNRLLEKTEVGVSDSEAIGTPKRVHFKPNNSFAHQVETPEIANARKGNGTSETSSTDTPSKKVKKKKGQSGPSDVETVSSLSIIQEVVKEVKKAAVETDCVETNLTTDRSEAPSKKVKNKKSKSVVEPVPNEAPKKVKAKKTEGPSEIDQETTSESVKPDSSSKKAKRKANERLSETLESETPSKKSKDVKEAGGVETPSKKLKAVLSDPDLLQSDSTNGSLKKRKSGKVADYGIGIQHDVPSETPGKSISQAQSQDDVANGLRNEETSSQDLKPPPKKKKRKLAAYAVGIQHDVPSETPVKCRPQAQSRDDVANSLGNEETSSQEPKTPSKKTKKNKSDEACGVPATPEAKKGKVKNKNKEAGNAEDAPQPPQPPEEVEEASVPVAMSLKKKKKKKENEREEEIKETVSDDPPVSAPVEEVAVHKKKKKASKEKRLSGDEAHGLNST